MSSISNSECANTNPMVDNCSNSAKDLAESSSTSVPFSCTQLSSVLDEFRADWHKELHKKLYSGEGDKSSQTLATIISNMEKEKLAKDLYRKAVDLEQKGKAYDAIPFYRKALQIEPNIEFKYYDDNQKMKVQSETSKRMLHYSQEKKDFQQDVSENLFEKFQLALSCNNYEGKLMQRNDTEISGSTGGRHISDLPPELILYILRWVISNQLDMRSLEQCGAVCRGLYLCTRDEELWRLACVKVWRSDVGTLKNYIEPTIITTNTDTDINENLRIPAARFSSWRQMFIERERVLFNGCYISKTTYLRLGENSFQDEFYRPLQLVEYYRYLRFLTDGTVLMLTTADEPVQAVGRLKNIHHLRSDILKGKYHLYDNILSVVLNKPQQYISTTKIPSNANNSVVYCNRYRHCSNNVNDISTNNTKYFLKFHILNSAKRKFSQLKWIHYSIVQTRNKQETTNEFELTPSKYPPLWFSIVRSYHMSAENPLD